MTKNILIVDIETSGFMPLGKILEIGAVSLNVETGEICQVFDSLCKPEGITVGEVMHSWIVENGYIDPAELKTSRPLKQVCAEFQATIDAGKWIGCTAYNRQFDFGFLEREGLRLPTPLPCPMLLATDVCKLPAVGGRRGYKWPKVEEAWATLIGTEYVEKHRGCDDAMHEAQIVWKLIEMGVYKF
jgi:DNA polymerase III subunit epsilon